MHESFESYWFECQCSSFHHSMRVCLDKQDGDIYISLNLNSWLPWYKRIWRAVVYIFRPGRSSNIHYEETILDSKDYNKIIALLIKSKRILNSKKA